MAALLALLSSVMWGTADFIGGLGTKRWPATQVVAVSQMVGLAGLLAAVLLTGAWRSDVGYLAWSVPAGLASVIGLAAFYRALAIGPMGIVSPVASLGVVLPLGFALIRGEDPSRLQLVGIAAALVGVVLAAGPEIRGARVNSLGLAAVSAVAFGVLIICLAQGSRSSALMTVTGMRAVSVGVLAVVLVLSRRPVLWDRRMLAMVAAVGVLDAGANLLVAIATTIGLLSTTSVLGNLYPGVTVLLAAWLLRERLLRVQYVGVVAVLLGVALISVG